MNVLERVYYYFMFNFVSFSLIIIRFEIILIFFKLYMIEEEIFRVYLNYVWEIYIEKKNIL